MTSAEILQGLFEVSLASSAACAVVLLLRVPLRRRLGAGAAYALWAMVPLAGLAMLLPAPHLALVAMPAAAAQMAVYLAPALAQDAALSGSTVVLLVWASGGLLMLVLLTWQQHRYLRALGPLQRRPDGCWQGRDVAGLPALVGLWQPRIVLPQQFDSRYSAQEQALIVLHERTHQRRGDHWVNAAVALWRCVFWFNPLFAFAQRSLRADQEFSCDARVIAQRGADRGRYASAMLKTSLALSPLPVGCHWQSHHPLKERLVMLKHSSQSPARRSVGLVCAVAIVAGVTATAWAAQPAKHASSLAAHATTMSAPAYPGAAYEQGLSGRVVLEISVGADGKPTAIEVVESSPAGVFDANTVAAAWKWQLIPTMENGQAVPGKVRVPVTFEHDQRITQDDGQPG